LNRLSDADIANVTAYLAAQPAALGVYSTRLHKKR